MAGPRRSFGGVLRKTWVRRGAWIAVAVLGLVQVVPFGRAHANPPVQGEPRWDSPRTRELARRACFDCHSNETRWPWYSHVAPVSWLVQSDVARGREALNFSEWVRPQEEAEEAAECVLEGSMPPRLFTLLHGEARLAVAERGELVRGLTRTLGGGAADLD